MAATTPFENTLLSQHHWTSDKTIATHKALINDKEINLVFCPIKIKELQSQILDAQIDPPAVEEQQTFSFKVNFIINDVLVSGEEKERYLRWNNGLKKLISFFYNECAIPHNQRKIYTYTNYQTGFQDTCCFHIVFDEPTVKPLMVTLFNYMNGFFLSDLKEFFGPESSLAISSSVPLPFCTKLDDNCKFEPFNIYKYNSFNREEKIVIHRIPLEADLLADYFNVHSFDQYNAFVESRIRAERNREFNQECLESGTIQLFFGVTPQQYNVFHIGLGLAEHINSLVDRTSAQEILFWCNPRNTTNIVSTGYCAVSLKPGGPTFTRALHMILDLHKSYKSICNINKPETIDNDLSKSVVESCIAKLNQVAFINASDM